MDRLSKLIKEARPLYKHRKKQKAIIKTIFVLAVPVIFSISVFQMYATGGEVYLALDNNILQSRLLEDDFGLLGLE